MNWRRTVVTSSAGLAMVSLGLGATLVSMRLRAQLDPQYAVPMQMPLLQMGHKHSAVLLLVALLLAPALCWKTANRAQRILFLTAGGSAVVSAMVSIGLSASLRSASLEATLHAFFGEIVAGCSVALAFLYTTWGSSHHAEQRITGGVPVRTLAVWLLPLLLSQVAMGALYRHEQWSVLPHMAGALVVSAILVATSVVLLQQAPEHPVLFAAARLVLGLVLLQVVLGIVDFLLRLLDFQDTAGWVPLSVAHVFNASLLLAAAVCETIAVLAYVRQD